MKIKKVAFFIIVGIVFLGLIFFAKNNYKKIKIGKNETSKSVENVKDFLFGINSYRAKIEVVVYSNKNKNMYVLEQEHIENKFDRQLVIEPENIAGIEIINEGGKVTVNNSRLNLSKIYNDYPYLANNCLDLAAFIEDIKKGDCSVKEENDCLVIETNSSGRFKGLYVKKDTGIIEKMIIKNDSQQDIIYIIYKEINLN